MRGSTEPKSKSHFLHLATYTPYRFGGKLGKLANWLILKNKSMKTIITLGIVMSVIGGIVFFYPSVTEVQNIREVIEVEKTVEVNVLEARIKEALDGAENDIKAKAEEAYNRVREIETKKIEDAVKAQYIKEIEATISSESY